MAFCGLQSAITRVVGVYVGYEPITLLQCFCFRAEIVYDYMLIYRIIIFVGYSYGVNSVPVSAAALYARVDLLGINIDSRSSFHKELFFFFDLKLSEKHYSTYNHGNYSDNRYENRITFNIHFSSSLLLTCQCRLWYSCGVLWCCGIILCFKKAP